MELSATLKEIAPLIEEACQVGKVDGAALAILRDGELVETVHGFANRPENIPATPGTLFHIGSVTKSITAELVWKLILEGRLSADMPVIEAAPELSHLAPLCDRRLTLAHLLSHSSGIDGDVIFDAGRGKDVLRRYMSEITELGSLFTPGAYFSYANLGYGILGRIVEIAGGAPFEDLLAKSLRNDHKLAQVAILPVEKIRQRTALHFTGEEPSYFWPHSNIASGTVLAMSMSDLARWGGSHFENGGAVPPLSVAMRGPGVATPYNHRYEGWGHGFTLLDGLGSTLIGHDGGTAGTSTYLRIAPERRVSWAFSATGALGGAVYRQLEPRLRELAGLEPQPARTPPGSAVPQDLSRYTGTYTRHGMSFTVGKGEGRTLTLAVDGPMSPRVLNALSLVPRTATVFELRVPALDATMWVSFHEFDGEGKPQLIFLTERMARRAVEGGA